MQRFDRQHDNRRLATTHAGETGEILHPMAGKPAFFLFEGPSEARGMFLASYQQATRSLLLLLVGPNTLQFVIFDPKRRN